ncbi:hypothetical protein [Caenimonas koreensis]|uniref:hypothetical protein n=1 Tax=Caenimonas koreensis TaxID=367474 RepID=UPI003783BF06
MPQIPFLVSLAKPCISPGRAATNSEYVYDHQLDMVRWTGDPTAPLAIERSGETGPMTKKADIEKGEDNKDRRMWR